MTGNERPPVDEALDSIRRAQAAVAERLSRGSWAYDMSYAFVLAAMIASCAVTMPLGGALFIGSLAVLLLQGLLWARRTGMWLSGITPKRARWVAYGLTACIVPLAVINLIWETETWPIAIPVATTIAGFVMSVAGSRLWWRVYRAESGL